MEETFKLIGTLIIILRIIQDKIQLFCRKVLKIIIFFNSDN